MSNDHKGAVAIHIAWRNVQLDSIQRAEDELAKTILLALVPAKMAVYFEEEDTIVPGLLQGNEPSRRYREQDLKDIFGKKTNFQEFRKRVNTLRKAWREIVKIDLKMCDVDRIRITFRVP